MKTTSPTILPLVLGDQPAAARVRVRPLSGSMMRAVADPRSQPAGSCHGSSLTFSSPYSFIFSAVHLLARSTLAWLYQGAPTSEYQGVPFG